MDERFALSDEKKNELDDKFFVRKTSWFVIIVVKTKCIAY